MEKNVKYQEMISIEEYLYRRKMARKNRKGKETEKQTQKESSAMIPAELYIQFV